MENLVKNNFFQSLLFKVKEIYIYRSVLYQLVKQYLRLKYRRTILGYFWTLLNPILMILVLGIVFSSLLKKEFSNFLLILFAGLIPWNMFSQIVTQSLITFLNNEELIKKIYIPKILFPFSVSIAISIDSLIFFIVIFPITFLIGAKLSLALLILPLSYILLFIFSFAISLIGSLICVFFRDFQWLVPVLLQALFFLTPILYEKVNVSEFLAYFNYINPLSPFISIFKDPIYYGIFPDIETFLIAFTIAFSSLIISLLIFVKFQKNIIYRL